MSCRFQYNSHIAALSEHVGQERDKLEQELLNSGVPVPLPHRVVWTQAQQSTRTLFVSVTDGSHVTCCFAADITRSRALPGHLILRVERLGPAANLKGTRAGLHALAAYAHKHNRILRLHMEVFSPDCAVRDSVAQVARALGFMKRMKPRMYTHTIAIDLRPSEEEIFASFHGTARRHVRAVDKNPVEVRLIENPSYSERMTALFRETMQRTGGRAEPRDWGAIVEFSKKLPKLSRVIGLHRADVDGPQALLAFAWGRFHGDHADYAAAASTRETDLKMAFGYAPAWDLMRWAKAQGAAWFDFGGITPGHHGEGDPKGGISDFKRYFGGEVIFVGEEWVLEPHPLKAKIANTVSTSAAWLQKLLASRS